MRDGHAWSGSEQSDDVNVSSSFKGSAMSLGQRLGLYEAASYATPQPLSNCVGAMPVPPSLEDSHNEKQALPTQIDSTTSAPPLKRSRRTHTTELNIPHRRAAHPSNKSLHQTTPLSKVQSEQPHQNCAQEREKSPSEECTILPQHHKLPCVRAEC